jgi:hypothetical protein
MRPRERSAIPAQRDPGEGLDQAVTPTASSIGSDIRGVAWNQLRMAPPWA